jgi:ribosomal large subunit pseudouridine synthase D (EC 5.4.99.-)
MPGMGWWAIRCMAGGERSRRWRCRRGGRRGGRVPRQALHAATLGFTHPESEERLTFVAPLPQDFKDLLAALGG